jgi:nucleotide-binding universal stress UspA family protein
MAERTPRILLPLDGSVPAAGPLEIAGALADVMEAEIDVLFVGPEPLDEQALADRTRVPGEWRPRVHLHGACGEPVAEILRDAAERPPLAVVITSHGATGDLKLPAGHVTLGVLEAPPCPVLVVRSALRCGSQAHRLRHLRRILVPLDGSPEAARSIEQACVIAARANAKVTVLHVVDVSEWAAPVTHTYEDQSQYEREAWADEFLRSSFAHAPRPPEVRAEVAMRRGDPGSEIAKFAEDDDCDLVVAAWGGRLSPGRARVVRTLLERAPCPLLFLRA